MKLAFALLNLLALPLIWFAPLFGAGLLPWFKLNEVSIITVLQALIEKDIALAILIAIFVIIMPLFKAIFMLMGALGKRTPSKTILFWIAKLSLLDLFLIAITIVVIKGVGIGRVEILWGFWLFAGYVLIGYGLALRKISP